MILLRKLIFVLFLFGKNLKLEALAMNVLNKVFRYLLQSTKLVKFILLNIILFRYTLIKRILKSAQVPNRYQYNLYILKVECKLIFIQPKIFFYFE